MNGNDFMPGGNPRKELMEYARVLSGNLVDALCINVGWHEARVPQIVSSVPRGAFSYLARGIRQEVTVPVIASHRINDPKTARQMLDDGMCDMVAMGRSLIADPMLPEKTRQGREHDIIHCIGCAQGCFDNLFRLKHVECLCNPLAGHETALPIEKAESPKKILVAGGGPAGMTAALAAASRGHEVTLYEGSHCLGGQLHLAAAPPGRQEFAQLIKDLETQIRKKNIPVFLNTMVDADLVKQENPDRVILATGAEPIIPPIPGIEGLGNDFPRIVESRDVLLDRVSTGRKVAVIGGGAVGVETALFLAEKGTLSADALKFLFVNNAEDHETLFDLATRGTKEIFLIEMMEKVGKDIGKSTKWGMMQDLGRYHITTITGSRVIEITPKGLVVEQNGRPSEIQADTIVVAAGAVSNKGLESMLKDLNRDYRVVGDASQVATAFEAVHQGYKAGMEI
jgi:2,4-dienoyl-CoA reductase (NADPH2)